MGASKLSVAMNKYGETDVTLARKSGFSVSSIHKWKAYGVLKKYQAYAIAYALDCSHKEILEEKANREGWDLTPCLPGLD